MQLACVLHTQYACMCMHLHVSQVLQTTMPIYGQDLYTCVCIHVYTAGL